MLVGGLVVVDVPETNVEVDVFAVVLVGVVVVSVSARLRKVNMSPTIVPVATRKERKKRKKIARFVFLVIMNMLVTDCWR